MNGRLLLIHIAVFLTYILMLYLIFIGIEKLFKKDKRKKVRAIISLSILLLFFLFYFLIPDKAKVYQKETFPHIIGSLNAKIRNDPRFEKVNFRSSGIGSLDVNGDVRNQKDYDALKQIASSYESSVEMEWHLFIDDRDFAKDYVRDPRAMACVGYVDLTHREQAVISLNNNAVSNFIRESVFPVDGSHVYYVYVSPGKEEIAINLLKQISSFKHR